ncbi:hypothetical protein BKA82DRAFT_4062714 [Pisolithus tinctorius]|nr:hypothetical protein BKA82DRAFT_4062714 [Pisolithus tinctorius]
MPGYIVGTHIVDPRILSEQVGGGPVDPDPFPSPARSDPRDQQPRSEYLATTVGLPIHLRRPSRTTLPTSIAPPSPDSHSVHNSNMSRANAHSYNDGISIYSDLETFTFGEARSSPNVAGHDAVSPLTPVVRPLGSDQTSGPLLSAQFVSPSLQTVCSHPSQGAGRPVPLPSTSSPHPVSPWSISRDTSSDRHDYSVAGTTGEGHERPAAAADREFRPFHPRRGRVIPDDASQHTFGHGVRHHGIASSSSSISVASSRSSSRASFRSELLSSDDELEVGDLGGDSSPVTFARDYPLADIDEDADLADLMPWYSRPITEDRRGSLPMDIPSAPQEGASRSRESSILTLRRPSRSLDDEYCSHISAPQDPSAISPKSEPHSRADWRSLEAQIQAQVQAESHATQSSTSTSQPPADFYSNFGLDIQYILQPKHSEGSIRSFRSSAQYSFLRPLSGAQSSEASSSKVTAIAPFAVGARRTSTATLQTVHSNEDPFFRHIRINDKGFDIMENQWLYQCRDVDFPKKRERQGRRSSNTPLPPLPPLNTELRKCTKTMAVGQREHWWCPNTGFFRVDRSVLKPRSPDGSEAVHHRLNIRHVKDPHSKASSAGPTSLVHKHSRVTGFSIFRLFALNAVNGPQHTRLNMRDGVLLAPRKVQEHFTSTKTTQRLATHGLLDDELRGSRGSRRGTQGLSFRDSHKRRAREAKSGTTKGKEKKTTKGKSSNSGGTIPKQETSTGSQDLATNSTGSTSEHAASAPVASSSHTQPSPKIGPAVGHPPSPEPPVPLVDSVQTTENVTSIVPSSHHREGHNADSEEERMPARTPHAEAFGALDPSDIPHYMSKANRPNADSGPSFPTRIWRALLGTPRPEGPSSSVGLYQPPWIVTGGREQQEESARVINDLTNSFRDVGLLHTQPHKSGSKSTSKRKRSLDVLEQIPEDCLYMLLPLWVGEVNQLDAETDGSETSATTRAPSATILPENRHYLLVWYVPWDDDPKAKNPEQQAQTRKSKHGSHTSSDSTHDAEPMPICLTSFRVIARVVRYDDLRHSGVRIPSVGLAISGPAWEALNDFDLMSECQDQRLTDAVICHCRGRHKGFSFDPQGLARLGLCTMETAEATSDADDPISSFSLTTIGKAAAEMIWLGCLAVTSFGP